MCVSVYILCCEQENDGILYRGCRVWMVRACVRTLVCTYVYCTYVCSEFSLICPSFTHQNFNPPQFPSTNTYKTQVLMNIQLICQTRQSTTFFENNLRQVNKYSLYTHTYFAVNKRNDDTWCRGDRVWMV